jgi:hypothetical protein
MKKFVYAVLAVSFFGLMLKQSIYMANYGTTNMGTVWYLITLAAFIFTGSMAISVEKAPKSTRID